MTEKHFVHDLIEDQEGKYTLLIIFIIIIRLHTVTVSLFTLGKLCLVAERSMMNSK